MKRLNEPPSLKSFLTVLFFSMVFVALFILVVMNAPRLPVNPATLGLVANGMLAISFFVYAIRDPQKLGSPRLRALAFAAGLLALLVAASIVLETQGTPVPEWALVAVHILTLVVNVRLAVGLMYSLPRRA